MRNPHIQSALLSVALIFGSATLLRAAEPQKEEMALSSKLITALEKADYASFVAEGEPAFKQLKPDQFQAVASQLASRFKGGYEVFYLGELKQKGYQVTLWKLSFKDGSDDALATLSVKGAKVGGFWIR